MSTSDAVTFAKNATGFPTDRSAIPIAIPVTVTTKILVLRIRDEITALSQAFPISCCSGSSACSERKRGNDRQEGNRLSSPLGDAPLMVLVDQYPASEGQKATITAAI